jgi:hypothetical protein
MGKVKELPELVVKMPPDMNNYFDNKIEEFRSQLSYPIAKMDNVVWYWDSRMDRRGIQGQYRNFYFDFERKTFIYRGILATSGKLMPEYMVGTVAHELRHAYLAQNFPHMIAFNLTRLPGLMYLQHKFMGVWTVEKEVNRLMGYDALNASI